MRAGGIGELLGSAGEGGPAAGEASSIALALAGLIPAGLPRFCCWNDAPGNPWMMLAYLRPAL